MNGMSGMNSMNGMSGMNSMNGMGGMSGMNGMGMVNGHSNTPSMSGMMQQNSNGQPAMSTFSSNPLSLGPLPNSNMRSQSGGSMHTPNSIGGLGSMNSPN